MAIRLTPEIRSDYPAENPVTSARAAMEHATDGTYRTNRTNNSGPISPIGRIGPVRV
jgi:hypothetical protein